MQREPTGMVAYLSIQTRLESARHKLTDARDNLAAALTIANENGDDGTYVDLLTNTIQDIENLIETMDGTG